MKRREIIKSLALAGLCASLFNYQSLIAMAEVRKPLFIAGLGYTPYDMIKYFKDCGLSITENNLYVQYDEKITHLGWKISDLIIDFEVLLSQEDRYLIIISPSEYKMKDLASGIAYALNMHKIEYHVIILGPYPFEGENRFKQTNNLIEECRGAKTLMHIEMREVIDKYGQLLLGDAMTSLYDELLAYIKRNIL